MSVLEPTTSRVCDQLGTDGELKGSGTHPDRLDEVLPSITIYGYEDNTVAHSNVPWATEHPIRNTLHDANPDIAKSVIGDVVGSELDAPVLLQTLALASVLNPLFYPDRLDDQGFTEATVVLDDETWRSPMERLKDGIGVVDAEVPDNLSFEVRDSKPTPGLQIADLTAYSWLRHRKEGDCGEAARAIDKRRFADY